MNRAEAIPGQLSFEGTTVGPDAPRPSAAAAPTVVTTPAVPTTAADTSAWIRPTAPEELSVEVVRSPRRRKTAQARLHGSRLEIRIPAGCSRAEEAELVTHFRAKFERLRWADGIDLRERASELAGRFHLPLPASIRWVSNQHHRWGSCTPADGSIRLSDRMTGFPPWVIDYVIVHELAHLVVAAHTEAFWRLVSAYPLTERARGFLMAKGWED